MRSLPVMRNICRGKLPCSDPSCRFLADFDRMDFYKQVRTFHIKRLLMLFLLIELAETLYMRNYGPLGAELF